VALPNKEIAFVFKKEILDKLTALIPQSTAISIQEALYTGSAADLQKRLETRCSNRPAITIPRASCFIRA
jgi:hypothetical protein